MSAPLASLLAEPPDSQKYICISFSDASRWTTTSRQVLSAPGLLELRNVTVVPSPSTTCDDHWSGYVAWLASLNHRLTALLLPMVPSVLIRYWWSEPVLSLT